MALEIPSPFGSSSAVTGFRPACRIGQGAAADGGGLLGAVASLIGAPQSDPWADHLSTVETLQAQAPFLDTCRISLVRDATSPAVAVDDKLTVDLGFDSALKRVFTGKVAQIDARSRSYDVVLAASSLALAQLRQNASFEQRTLGDLARLWAGEVGVTPGTIDAGPTYPFLAVDDRRSAWEWLASLGRLAKFRSWVDGDGHLHCRSAAGAAVRIYHHGQDVLSMSFSERTSQLGEVTMTGEGAAGSQGSQAWSWLLKSADEMQATSGQGVPKRLYQDGALRNRAAVTDAAAGVSEPVAALRSIVTVTVPGSADVGVGSKFTLKDCPDGRGDGDYVVLRLRHQFGKMRGFVSELVGARA